MHRNRPEDPYRRHRDGSTFLYGERDERAAFASNVTTVPTPYEAKAVIDRFASGPTEVSLTAIGSPTPANQFVEAA
jgi:hypothetical protein